MVLPRSPAGPGGRRAGVKAALIADEPDVFVTTPHVDGHAPVPLRLSHISDAVLRELVEDAWRTSAPRRLLTDRDH